MPRTFTALALLVVAVSCWAPAKGDGTGAGALPGSLEGRTLTPQQLQIRLQTFVDVASQRLDEAGARIVGETTDPLVRLRAQQLAVYPRMAMMQIVTGPDPDAALLDLMVLTSAFRLVIEDHWVPKLFKQQQGPVLEAVRQNERDIDVLADEVMSQRAQDELVELVAEWRRQNPEVTFVGGLRFREIVTGSVPVGESLRDAVSSGGLMGSLQGTRRELQETRLLAERGMYFAQRLPDLLVSQAQISILEVLNMPESQAVLTNVDRVTEAAERVSNTVAALPVTLDTTLEEHEAALAALLAETRQTAESTRELSESLRATVAATDGLMARFQPAEGREPGEILDEARVLLEQTTVAARELTVTADALQQLLSSPAWDERQPQLEATLDRVDDSGRALVELAFQRAAMLVGIMLAAALVYRFAGRRMG